MKANKELKLPTSPNIPNSIEAENALLGSIILDNTALDIVLETIDTDDFYSELNRHIFEVMKSLSIENTAIDIATIISNLPNSSLLHDAGGIHYLMQLPNNVPSAYNARYYAKIIHEKSILRQILQIANTTQERALSHVENVSDFVDDLNQQIFSLSVKEGKQPFFSMKEVVKETFNIIENLYEKKEQITGVSSGFLDLDEMTSGFQKSDLIILAARPSMGKTALSLNFLANAALDHNLPAAFFSLEMSKEQLATRILCSRAKIDAGRLKAGLLIESEWARLIEAAGALSDAPIYIDDTPALPISKLQAKARRLKAEKNIALIVVDYLQLMRTSDSSQPREQVISEISRSLKAIAKELDLPVIALSQLNRGVDARTDKRPILSDLRESGAIEQDADIIFFIYRDEVYNKESQAKGIAEIIIAKHRNGPIGTVKLKWFGQHTLFENLLQNDLNPNFN